MSEIVEDGQSERVIAFAGPATIPHVTDAWSRLEPAVAAGCDVVVDVSQVDSADLSFIQLIECARTSCAQVGANLRLSQPADGALLDVLDRGGFLDAADTERLQFWTHAGAAQ